MSTGQNPPPFWPNINIVRFVVEQFTCPYCQQMFEYWTEAMRNILIRSLIFQPESVSQTADGVWFIDSTAKKENIQVSFPFCELHQEITKLGGPLAVDFVALPARIQLLKPIIKQILENPDSYPLIARIRDVWDPSRSGMPRQAPGVMQGQRGTAPALKERGRQSFPSHLPQRFKPNSHQ